MISPISSATPRVISESYRLLQDGHQQARAMSVTADFIGLRIIIPGVIVEISQSAIRAAQEAKKQEDDKKIQPIGGCSSTDSQYAFNRP